MSLKPLPPYDCHNRPRPVAGASPYPAQDGWIDIEDTDIRISGFETGLGRTSRLPRIVQIKHVMSTECRYDKPAIDPRCAGCIHIPPPKP